MTYRPLLFLHWKQIRFALIPLAIASFGLPILAVDGLGVPAGAEAATLDAFRMVLGFQEWVYFFPLLALGIGTTLALSAWNWDHQLNHVYSLTLPMTRWEYTASKMLAGATLALIPTATLWAGAHLAAASLTLPAGLNAYPNELAVRFFFATLVPYAAFFALAAGTIRTTVTVLGTVLGAVVMLALIGDLLPGALMYRGVDLLDAFVQWSVNAPGPFEVVTGSWSLIDV